MVCGVILWKTVFGVVLKHIGFLVTLYWFYFDLCGFIVL